MRQAWGLIESQFSIKICCNLSFPKQEVWGKEQQICANFDIRYFSFFSLKKVEISQNQWVMTIFCWSFFALRLPSAPSPAPKSEKWCFSFGWHSHTYFYLYLIIDMNATVYKKYYTQFSRKRSVCVRSNLSGGSPSGHHRRFAIVKPKSFRLLEKFQQCRPLIGRAAEAYF